MNQNQLKTISKELKFRVWNGMEMVYDVTVGKFGTFYVNPSNNGLDPNDSASLTSLTTKYADGTPTMRFTGLIDKNGIEIYEGDIVKDPEGYECQIIFDNYLAKADLDIDITIIGFLRKWADGDISPIGFYHIKLFEVIGNIYANPELIPRAAGV